MRWRDALSRARRCQLQPRVGSPSAWSRCLRSTTRSIGAPAIRRSCKRHCLIPRIRTGQANSFRRAGQRGRRRDRGLRAPTQFKDLHRPPILRAVRPLRPPPSLRRPRVRRQPVPLDFSLAPACQPLPRIPRRLEHQPPRRYRLCLHSSPGWPTLKEVDRQARFLQLPQRPALHRRTRRCRPSRNRRPSARRAPRSKPRWLRPRWLRPLRLRPLRRIRCPPRRLSLLKLPRLPVVRLRWRIRFSDPIPT